MSSPHVGGVALQLGRDVGASAGCQPVRRSTDTYCSTEAGRYLRPVSTCEYYRAPIETRSMGCDLGCDLTPGARLGVPSWAHDHDASMGRDKKRSRDVHLKILSVHGFPVPTAPPHLAPQTPHGWSGAQGAARSTTSCRALGHGGNGCATKCTSARVCLELDKTRRCLRMSSP